MKKYLSGEEFLEIKQEIKDIKKKQKACEDFGEYIAYANELRYLYQKLRGC